ncbi:hypothetical protein Mapa_012275 [Marchantia paleacea]|nr:hypothetical protein Mapa_012275 [Marchantia paleacea]
MDDEEKNRISFTTKVVKIFLQPRVTHSETMSMQGLVGISKKNRLCKNSHSRRSLRGPTIGDIGP